jgi:hypothetical protein
MRDFATPRSTGIAWTAGREKAGAFATSRLYKLTPKSCPIRAGRLKAATSRAMSSSSRPKNGVA